MNFYNDLPPPTTSQSNEAENKQKDALADVANVWGSLFSDTKPAPVVQNKKEETKPAPSHQPISISVQPAKKAKMVPSSLVFKPRQTAISTTTTSVVKRERSHSITDNQDQKETEGQQATKSNIEQIAISSTTKSVDNNSSEKAADGSIESKDDEAELIEIEEFNNNSSFEVDDMYDPRRPNDYLQYCEEQLEEKRRAQLMEDNRKRMEVMEKQRNELEIQRREAAEKKDYRKLIEVSAAADVANSNSNHTNISGMGRGRGRGMVNLPAWLTQQINTENTNNTTKTNDDLSNNNENNHPPQQFQDSNEFISTSTTTTTATAAVTSNTNKRKAAFISKPTCVVLLKNMVSINEILAKADRRQIEDETHEECEKYGEVLRCEIYYLDGRQYDDCPDCERVRTFVHFKRQDAAVKAWKDMNGRFFGGRKITASFYDEVDYEKGRLSPLPDEW